MRDLFLLGVSGGLVPCPSALVVLLSAIALQRVALGLALILAFSLGLALVLVLLGILAVKVERGLSRRLPGSWLRALPRLSGALVSLLGLGLCVQALLQVGLFGG